MSRWIWYSGRDVKEVAKTAANGSYSIIMEGGFNCKVYAYYDNQSSPGYDYLPKLQTFNLEKDKEVDLDFKLIPAASVILEGEVLFVDSSKPPEPCTFTVLLEEELPEIEGSILNYGPSASAQNSLIGMNSSHIVVPANTSFKISVTASTKISYSFFVNDSQFSGLGKGEGVRVKVGLYSLPISLELTRDAMQISETRVAEAEGKAFYILAETRDLARASALVEEAEAMFDKGFYEESYADLRQAYTKATYISEKVLLMFANASASVPILVVFLAFASVALSYLLFEDWARKALTAGLLYILFIAIFFYVYAGCRVVDVRYLLAGAVASISILSLVAFVLPRFFSVAIFFSMAKRNIKRRVTRFTLTLVPIAVLVMSFVALTSFSQEYGFVTTTVGAIRSEARGFLVRQQFPDLPDLTEDTQIVANFKPMETSAVEWLLKKPEVTLAAPKAENFATRSAMGAIFAGGNRLSLFGVIGILPSVEAEATGLDRILVEGQGRYLQDDEEDSVMITASAAETLGVSVGDRLTLTVGRSSVNATLVGLLDDDSFGKMTDLDGAPMVPRKVIIQIQDGTVVAKAIVPCEPSEVAVVNLRTASKLSGIFLSRIDVIAADNVDIIQFARQVALERDYWVWAAAGGKINLLGVMSYLEAKGISVFIPWLIVVLNVVIVMLNAVYERRRDVAILSSVGLNPTHITSLFGAEALIIGIIGGGLGYLIGLSSYQVMALLPLGIEVRQKITVEWCLASLAVSLTAVLVGTFVALKSSVVITPSLLRRWSVEQKPRNVEGRWDFEIPIRLREEEVESLFNYAKRGVQDYVREFRRVSPSLLEKLTNEGEEKTSDSHVKFVDFRYRFGRDDPIGMFPFRLVAERKDGEDFYKLRIIAEMILSVPLMGESSSLFNTLVTFIRMLVVEWSAREK